jgi:hypothetical protein
MLPFLSLALCSPVIFNPTRKLMGPVQAEADALIEQGRTLEPGGASIRRRESGKRMSWSVGL